MLQGRLLEICSNCGYTRGAHFTGTYLRGTFDYCPGNVGRMNWDKEPGTCFEPTGTFRQVSTSLEDSEKKEEKKEGEKNGR